jgi:hypothetical protein
MWSRIAQLWRTTTFRLTALFIVIFVVFSVLLLGAITYQSSIQIQNQQARSVSGRQMDIALVAAEQAITRARACRIGDPAARAAWRAPVQPRSSGLLRAGSEHPRSLPDQAAMSCSRVRR